MANTAVQEPITAVGYDANGEAVDVPVDTRPAPELPGFESEAGEPDEMFEGKRIIGNKWSFTGNHQVNRLNGAMVEKLDMLGEGKSILLLIQVEPGDVSFQQSTEDGHIRGVFHKRKLHITDVYAADDIEGSEALFEGGLLRVKRQERDDIGYLTGEPDEIPDGDVSPLAESLAEAMPIEPGMCGMKHPGHLNQCRQPAHSCPLRDN